MNTQPPATTGFSLIEILIVCALSVFLMTCLSILLHNFFQQSTQHQQALILQQRLWLVERVTLHAIETAGASAAFPADPDTWYTLTQQAANLRLYQYDGQSSVPLPHSWLAKLLKSSTVLETEALNQAQFAQQMQKNSIDIGKQPLAKKNEQWLLSGSNTWQLLTIHRVTHFPDKQQLEFTTTLSPDFHLPFLAGPYQHRLWFVALNGKRAKNGRALYALYRWDLTEKNTPQEIVSGVTVWHGEIIARTQNTLLIEWHISLSEGNQSLSQVIYALNNNLA